jgi:hypothetical protein
MPAVAAAAAARRTGARPGALAPLEVLALPSGICFRSLTRSPLHTPGSALPTPGVLSHFAGAGVSHGTSPPSLHCQFCMPQKVRATSCGWPGGGGRKRAFSAHMGGLEEDPAEETEDTACTAEPDPQAASPVPKRRRSARGGPCHCSPSHTACIDVANPPCLHASDNTA